VAREKDRGQRSEVGGQRGWEHGARGREAKGAEK